MRGIRFKHIVVATDLSAASAATYSHAAGLAQVFDARVSLVYVDELAAFSLRTSQQVVD